MVIETTLRTLAIPFWQRALGTEQSVRGLSVLSFDRRAELFLFDRVVNQTLDGEFGLEREWHRLFHGDDDQIIFR